jgi:hypothetical protein
VAANSSTWLALFLLFLLLNYFAFFFILIWAIGWKVSSFTTSEALYFIFLAILLCSRVISLNISNITIVVVVFIWAVWSKMSFLVTYEAYKPFFLVILVTMLVLVLVVLSPLKLRTLGSYMPWLFTVIANNHVGCPWYHICLIIRI